MLYLQKYLTNFQKRFSWLKDDEVEGGYCNVINFPTSRKCKNFNFSLYTVPSAQMNFGLAAIATLPLFQHPENVKISIFPLHCPSRNAISSKVFNEFSKTFFWLKDDEGGYCCWKSQVHRYFGFAIQRYKFSNIQKM